jgi:hypothetical protein
MGLPFYYAAARLSTMRPLFFVLVVCSSLTTWAASPKFSEGGVVVGLQYGPGFWVLDRAFIGNQVGLQNADTYIHDVQNTHTLALRLGYNILGHATLEADLLATGWNLSTSDRGGAGFLTGVVAWHPLELVFLNKAERPIPLDASMSFGVGYGIAGQRLGMDGLVLQWGMNAEWWFNRFFGVGAFVRGTFMKWGSMYLDYDHRSSPGNTLALPQTSGGAFWHPGIELLLRFGE